MPIAIRPITLDDFDALAVLLDEIHDYHVAGAPHAFKHAEAPVLPFELIAVKLAQDDQLFLAALDGARIVGFVWGQLQEQPETHTHRPRRIVRIDTLGITSTHRGMGIGRALMEAAEQWGRELGAQAVALTVWQFNDAAVAFYEHLGYRSELIRMIRPLDPPDAEAHRPDTP